MIYGVSLHILKTSYHVYIEFGKKFYDLEYNKVDKRFTLISDEKIEEIKEARDIF